MKPKTFMMPGQSTMPHKITELQQRIMNKSFTIYSSTEADICIESIKKNIIAAIHTLRTLLEKKSAPDLFYSIKFKQIGLDPLKATPLNFIEQLNQSYTYLVTLKAVKYLFKEYSDIKSYKVNIGTAPGLDIESIPEGLVAETFATTNPKGNQKMKKDISKVDSAYAKHKYVFYHSPIKYTEEPPEGIAIVYIDLK